MASTGGRRWTDEEIGALERCYASKGAVGVAEMLGRTVNSVTNKAHEKGLKFHLYRKQTFGEIRFVPKEVPSSLEAVIGYLRSVGMDVEDRGNGLYILGGVKSTANQLASAANDHRVRNTRLPILRLGMPDPATQSMTGCAAAMTAGV